jgi:hypothetical protein
MNDFTDTLGPRRRSTGMSWRRDRRVLATTMSSNESKTAPSVVRLSSSMKIVTLDESLHSKYGDKSRLSIKSAPATLPSHHIRWDCVQIREYARCLGDNPSCSSGPPVSIGWDYSDNTVVSLDKYEENRPPRRTNGQMLLPRSVRQEMLLKEWEVPRSQIASAVRTNIKVKNQRRQTVNNMSQKNEKIEKIVQSAGRKLKRTVLFKKKPSKEIQELQRQADKAAAVIAQINAEEEAAHQENSREPMSYEQENEEEKTEEKSGDENDKEFILRGVGRRISEVSFSEADRASGEGTDGEAYLSDCTSLTDDELEDFIPEKIDEEKPKVFEGPHLQTSPIIITEQE